MTSNSVGRLNQQNIQSKDFIVGLSRVLFYFGLLSVSLLVFRIGGFITIGDTLMMSSAALLTIAHKEEAPARTRGVAVILSLILLGGCVASAVSPNPLDSIQVLLRVIYVALVLPWQARRLLNTPKRLSAACTVFAAGAAICGSGALLQSKLGSNIIPGADVTNAGRYSGFAAHVSDTGGISALATVVGVAGLGAGTSFKTKLISMGILAGGIIGLVLSGSVSGMISAAVGIGVILILGGIGFWRLILVSVAGAGAMYIASDVISGTQHALDPLERFNQTLGLSGSSDQGLNTTASRLATDRLGLDSFIQHPLTGVGLDTQSSLIDPAQNLAVHNFLIGAMHQGGIIFAVGIVLASAALVLPGLRKMARNSLSVRTLSMTAAAIVFSVTAPSFFNRYYWVPLALLAAYAALANRGRLMPTSNGKSKSTEVNKHKQLALPEAYRNLQVRLTADESYRATERPSLRDPERVTPPPW